MKRISNLLFLFSLVVLLCTAAISQTPTGSIEGSVSDASGLKVSGATVSLIGAATGQTLTTTTNAEGLFSFRSLQPGTYNLKVEQTGFATATAENLVVQVGQIARADVALKVGSPTETVQVEIGATDAQVDTVRQTLDGVISGRQISALPLNERNFLDLAVLQPGVTVVDGGDIDPTKVNAYRAVRVNGGSGTGTRVQIEGIDVSDETVGSTTANFSTDAVQEFNLARSSFDLSTSLTTSGAVSVATRTGGNKFSGSGFYFKQDDKFDARPGFEAEKPEFNRDQEGYRFGGPIIKDRLFFFSNFERFNQVNFTSFTSADFPQLDVASSFPIKSRYALNRVDWVPADSLKIFYLHNYNDDISTGGNLRSPFSNVDWTNTHVIGANFVQSNFTHSLRFGYVNFNNRIESTELSGLEFPTTPQGIPLEVNVGDISIGPNSLAPQQTYQDNKQFKYDGTALLGKHLLRYGGEANNFVLGGFANFAGPLTAFGSPNTPDTPDNCSSTDPLDCVLDDFTTGPQSGFFTARPAHNLPFGGKFNTRYGLYVGDQWRLFRNLTINAGVRWNYETNFFSDPDVPRLPQLDLYGAGLGDSAKFPKDAFSPQLGFAWDVFGDGKTSVRGGFYLAYESNIFNNSLWDTFSRNTSGIGPSFFDSTFIAGPDGSPIVVPSVLAVPGCEAGDIAEGDYTCLAGLSIRQAAPFLGDIHEAVQAAYGSVTNYDPTTGPSEFEIGNGNTFGGQFSGQYKIPYSMQFNIGIQRELAKGHVLSVDYVHQRGVGLPILLADYEQRRDVAYFDQAAAADRIATFLDDCGQTSIANAIANGCLVGTEDEFQPGIADLLVDRDDVWTGRTDLTRARIIVGGFTRYQALQVKMDGRLGNNPFSFLKFGDRSLLKGLTYTVAYSLASNKSTNGSSRPEFIANTVDNHNYNSAFGYATALDRRHNLTVSASMDLIGGLRLDQIYRFATPPPIDLFVPNPFGRAGMYTADLNGDGGFGTTPRVDLIPTTNIGAFGRTVSSIEELNEVLTNFNNTVAGQLTPHGQRLVASGLITEAELRALGGEVQPIALVPTSNPNPFQNRFTADYRLTRPIRIWKETWILEPSLSVFNVFNNAPKGLYTGLDGGPGSLNCDYANDESCGDLDRTRGLVTNRRQFQFGIRFSF